MPEASRDRSSETFGNQQMRYVIAILGLIVTCVLVAAQNDPIYVDLNFDGYPDKMILLDRGAGRNVCNETYEISVFNPRTKQYEYNEQLSEVGSPEPNKKDKTIKGFWRSGPVDTFYVYQWKGYRLILIKETECEYKENGTLTTEKAIKRGKLVVTSIKFDRAE